MEKQKITGPEVLEYLACLKKKRGQGGSRVRMKEI
jgi:hypothetical protein